YSAYLASPERKENQSTENIRPIYAVPVHADPVVLLGRGKQGPLLDAAAEHRHLDNGRTRSLRTLLSKSPLLCAEIASIGNPSCPSPIARAARRAPGPVYHP